MGFWVLRAEGVNFDATIYDTNDLSTTRGGSLALLQIDKAVETVFSEAGVVPDRCFSGASQCAVWFEAEDRIADALRKDVEQALQKPGDGKTPFSALTFVVDVAEGGSLDRAEALNRTSQFRQWTLPPQRFAASAADADPLETIRPGTEPRDLPLGKVLLVDEPVPAGEKGSERRILSATVAQRRDFGRDNRLEFYRTDLKDDADRILGDRKTGLSFTNNFKDIVADPPAGLPPSLRSKIAVVYADGNGFGKIRDTVPVEVFSNQLKDLRRKLLRSILHGFAAGAGVEKHWPDFAVADHSRKILGLRFETLLWGGDECRWVLPAWLVMPFLSGFFQATANWEIGGKSLTHAVGVAIAHYKTPIRQLSRIAKSSADLAKDAGFRGCNSVSFDIYESLSPQDGALAPSRARLYGMEPGDEEGQTHLARQLALPGDGFDTMIDNLRTLTKGGKQVEPFPRSQIYAALRDARATGDLTGEDAGKAARESLDFFARRPEGKSHLAALDSRRLPTCPGAPERSRAVELALVAQFWDYADPLDGRVTGFGPAEKQA